MNLNQMNPPWSRITEWITLLADTIGKRCMGTPEYDIPLGQHIDRHIEYSTR